MYSVFQVRRNLYGCIQVWEQLFNGDVYTLKEHVSLKRRNIVKQCNVIVDGQYINSHCDISLPYRGSKNQRLIDVQQSLQQFQKRKNNVMKTEKQLKIEDITARNKYYIKNPSTKLLKKNGFRYDTKCSTKDCECYIQEFPVALYKKTPVIICQIRVYMDNGDVTVDVRNNFGLLPEWYQKENLLFAHYKSQILKINKRILYNLKRINVRIK